MPKPHRRAPKGAPIDANAVANRLEELGLALPVAVHPLPKMDAATRASVDAIAALPDDATPDQIADAVRSAAR